MNQVDSHIPKLTIVQFKIKKRCPISALLWASCGDQDTRYINPVFQAWILHEAPQARVPAILGKPLVMLQGQRSSLKPVDLDVEEVWPTVSIS